MGDVTNLALILGNRAYMLWLDADSDVLTVSHPRSPTSLWELCSPEVAAL